MVANGQGERRAGRDRRTGTDRRLRDRRGGDGNAPLTPRERECVTLLARGLRNGQIADRLGIREVTVALHLRNAKRKLGATTREEAVAIAVRRQLLE